MKTESLVKKSLLFPKQNFDSFEEIIKHVGSQMESEGYVKDTYIEAVVSREKEFPTGLEMLTGGISIPHTDRNHVNKSIIGVVTLNEPIEVHSMINPIDRINVTTFFVLAIENPDGQIKLLKKLMSMFQDKEFKEKIENAINEEELFEVLEKAEI